MYHNGKAGQIKTLEYVPSVPESPESQIACCSPQTRRKLTSRRKDCDRFVLWAAAEVDAIKADKLKSLKDLVDQFKPFKERRARASERLAQSGGREWNFAILGIHTDIEWFSLAPIGEFRRVLEPPGEIELAAALRDPRMFGAVGRYSHGISHELAMNREIEESDQQAVFDLAWIFISALRVKTLAEFLVPAAADHSWSVIAALEQQCCEARLIEDVPQARRVEAPVLVREGDLEWVVGNVTPFMRMLQVPKFHLAVEAITTHQHLLSSRMMVASLWSGIEALMGIQAELRFRLALSVACALEPRGAQRVGRYRQVKKLYDCRSRAVHGAEMSEDELASHIIETRRILSAILCRMIEGDKVLSEEDIERELLQ